MSRADDLAARLRARNRCKGIAVDHAALKSHYDDALMVKRNTLVPDAPDVLLRVKAWKARRAMSNAPDEQRALENIARFQVWLAAKWAEPENVVSVRVIGSPFPGKMRAIVAYAPAYDVPYKKVIDMPDDTPAGVYLRPPP